MNTTVTLGKVARTLKYDTHALSELEFQSDRTLGWFLTQLAHRQLGPAVAKWMMWAGLQHEQAPPTMRDVEAMLDEYIAGHMTYIGLYAPIDAALTAFMLPAGPEGNATPEGGSPSPTSGSASG